MAAIQNNSKFSGFIQVGGPRNADRFIWAAHLQKVRINKSADFQVIYCSLLGFNLSS